MSVKKWMRGFLSSVLAISLLVPSVTFARVDERLSATPVSDDSNEQPADTKAWLSAYKEVLQAAKKLQQKKSDEIPSFTKDEVMAMTWDSLPADVVWGMYQSFDRKTLQIAAYFYPLLDRFLSQDEKVKKYQWTDEAVMSEIGRLGQEQYTLLKQALPVIEQHYQRWKETKGNKAKAPLSSLADSGLTSSPPDEEYEPEGLTYRYKRNTENLVDELYRTANIKETDVHLEGKHGMDLKLERQYSSLDAMLGRIYYKSKWGENIWVGNGGYHEKYHLPVGWKWNIPMIEEIDRENIRCTYDEDLSKYFCNRTHEKDSKRYVFTLDDGTVLESKSKEGDWVNYPYLGASMEYKRWEINGVEHIAWLRYNGYLYNFSIEKSYNSDGDTYVVTKTNAYGDEIVYRIPEKKEKPIEIIDSVGRCIVMDKHIGNLVSDLKVYADASKSRLLKHIKYNWNETPSRVIEHDVNGNGSKIIAEYTYHDSGVFGEAEFNLKPGYSFPANIPLDYNGMESTVYTTDDYQRRGTTKYNLLREVSYPVEGLQITYTYSPYQPDEPDFLSRGVVRLYHDDEKLTYTSYHPVTAVDIRFAKTPHPERQKQGWYSHTIYYPLTNKEIWKSSKDLSVRLKNQTLREGAIVKTQIVQYGNPNQEKVFTPNPDKTFLPQSVKTYIGTGADTDTILLPLTLTEGEKEYRYHPVSYVSYLYSGRETKPRYEYRFLGRPASFTDDADVYQFLLAPDINRLDSVASRLSKYAQVTAYSYNSYGDLTKLVDPQGNETTWTYTATTYYLRLLTKMKRTAAGNPNHFHEESYTYNADKLLETEHIVDSYPDGTTTKREEIARAYQYNSQKLVSTIVEATKGSDEKFFDKKIESYDRYGLYPTVIKLEVETSPETEETLTYQFDYDELGRVVKRIYPDQSQAMYQYDLLGRLTIELFANEGQFRTIFYDYDDTQRKVTMTLPDGTEEFTHFTPFGEVEYKGQRGTNGEVRLLLYNTYTSDGRLESSAPYADDSRATSYFYNEDGSLLGKQDPKGYTMYYRANAYRDKDSYLPVETVRSVESNGLTVTHFANRHGQLQEEIRETGDAAQRLAIRYEYNPFDQMTRKTERDQTGKTRSWTYHYNINGNLVRLVDPEQNVYGYSYDAYGNLVSVQENNTLTTEYHYNPLSWKISEKDVPSGATESFHYYPNGKTRIFTDKAGNRHEYAYTPFYEVSSITTKDAAGVVKNKETWEYYPNTSLVKKETNSNGPDTRPTSSNYREVQYSYDPFHRLNRQTVFDRVYQIRYTDHDDLMDQLVYPDNTVVSYRYDDAERLLEVSSNVTGTIRYAYHTTNTGETYTLTYPNGLEMERKLDSFGQVKELTHRKRTTPIWTETNQYSFGNVVSITRNGTTFAYEYDKIDRLTKETLPSGTNRYAYDTRGNRKSFEGVLPIDTDTVTYTFDERNRLRSYANERTGDEGSYTYYGNGLRATKEENGNQTKYVYLNGNVIEELDNAGNVKARNIWGNELLFRKDVGANKQGYYLYNSHGDVVSITDSSGTELNRYDYDSWGNLVAQTETMSNPFKYSGEIFDEKTGYYYLRARYYDPKIGRFISEDTYKGQVDNPLSLNRYTYVHNNPLRFVDPTGHWCESADGKWAHAGSCNDRSNMSRYEPDYKHDNDFIVENGVIKGVYEHVEGAREDIALEVNTFMLFAPIPKFLWGAKAAGAGKTAVTVWDTIKVTQAAVKGTNIPKSFVLSGLKAGGHEIWVHPNATKHMIDYMLKNERVINLSTQSKQMIEQAMLTSFRSAVEKAMPNLKPGRNFMTVGQWEIGINITEAEAVIYHALFR